MKHYHLTAKDVGDLTRILCAAVEPSIAGGRACAFRYSWAQPRGGGLPPRRGPPVDRRGDSLTAHPVDIIRLFHVAKRHDLDIHPNTLRLIAKVRLIGRTLKKIEANRLFVEM